MKKILFCWELGVELGHLGQFYAIINELLARDYKIYFIVKDLSKVSTFNWPNKVIFLQAPIWLPRLSKPIKNKSFAEILVYKGYHSPAALMPLVEAWHNLFKLIQPDALIFDHSPTALLASSNLGIPRIILSNAFLTPPAGTPPQNIRPWESVDKNSIEENERYIVKVINKVAGDVNLPTIQYVSDLFNVEKVILAGFSELDFYKKYRTNVSYKGSTIAIAGFEKPIWPSYLSNIKIFAYLRYGNEQAEKALSILSSLDASVICYYVGAKSEDYKKYTSEKMIISNKPFDLTLAYKEADVVVSHGGIGMVHSALQAGCPMILFPLQLEQQNTAYVLEKMKIAAVVLGTTSLDVAIEKVHDFFNTPIYFESAKSFALNSISTSTFISDSEICDSIENFISVNKK